MIGEADIVDQNYARQAYSDLFELVKFSLSPVPPIAIMVFSRQG
ncbi:hypothetical protein NO365_02266 [Planktothrix agardhii]|jgi:hypothetical protein|nr:hypothetical protein NO365_02266 [Planktothrix agardhii]